MKRYHLCKQSRLYYGEPYCGPTSGGKKAEFDSLEEAKLMAFLYNEKNPVGWDVYDSTTEEKV